MPKLTTIKTAIAALMCTLSLQAQALDDQWYVGIGGGISNLTPNPEDDAVDRLDEDGAVGTLFLGRDFDNRSSGQLQLFSLGEIDFDNGESITYSGVEAALLYRFYDTRDNQRGDGVFGASIYGRFGLGFINRDTDVDLTNEADVYFGAGAGVETYFTNNLGLRAEFQYFDSDAVGGTLSVVGRFGGLRRDLARRPPPITNQVAAFPSSQEGVPEETENDIPDGIEAEAETGNQAGTQAGIQAGNQAATQAGIEAENQAETQAEALGGIQANTHSGRHSGFSGRQYCNGSGSTTVAANRPGTALYTRASERSAA